MSKNFIVQLNFRDMSRSVPKVLQQTIKIKNYHFET
jgi:hypothetical protein